MKLKTVNLAIASGLAFAIIWFLCSGFVFALPSLANAIYRGMMHASPDMPAMQVSTIGFLIGLLGWSVSAAITGGALAVIYNLMSGEK